MNTPCQDSPLGLALLTRPPVRLWVTVGTGAKGFSGLPNQNPVLNVSLAPEVLQSPGSQKVWAELQHKSRLNSSQNCLGKCFKPPERGEWASVCFPLSSKHSIHCYCDDKPTLATASAVVLSHWARLGPQQLPVG